MTPFQQLAQVKAITKEPGLTLRPHDEITTVLITENKVGLHIRTYRFEDRAREIRFTARGTKMIVWDRDATQWTGWKRTEMVLWEDDYQPETIIKFGRSNTPAEVAARRQFEKDCFRPGTSRNPLDNYERVIAGPTTPAMERYF